MATYHLKGAIYLESTGTQAEYDVEVDFDEEPDEMDVLKALLSIGDIQIMHESTEEVDDEDEEE